MVWVEFVYVVTQTCRSTLMALRYRDEVIGPIVRPFVGAVSDNFICMHYNTPHHTARLVSDYLDREEIYLMFWPARLPT